MSRISTPSIEASLPASQPLLEAVKRQLGVVPNMFRLIGNSPAGLEEYLALMGALGKGELETTRMLSRPGRPRNTGFVAIDNKVVASVELAPQRMVVRDVESTLIGYFDCPPSGVKQAVLSYCTRRNLADEL